MYTRALAESTPAGRRRRPLLGSGGSQQAATLMDLPVARSTLLVYTCSGFVLGLVRCHVHSHVVRPVVGTPFGVLILVVVQSADQLRRFIGFE